MAARTGLIKDGRVGPSAAGTLALAAADSARGSKRDGHATSPAATARPSRGTGRAREKRCFASCLDASGRANTPGGDEFVCGTRRPIARHVPAGTAGHVPFLPRRARTDKALHFSSICMSLKSCFRTQNLNGLIMQTHNRDNLNLEPLPAPAAI